MRQRAGWKENWKGYFARRDRAAAESRPATFAFACPAFGLFLLAAFPGLFTWTTTEALWAFIIIGFTSLMAIIWAIFLRGRVQEQTGVLLRRLQRIAALEEQYRDLFENANDMIFTLGLRGHFTTLNQAGERITEYPRTKIIGKNIRDLVAPEHSALVDRMMEAGGAGGNGGTHEVEILTRTGRRVPLEIRTRRIYSEGMAVGIQGIARDATERKQAEKALAVERNLLRTLIDTLPDYVYVKDSESRFLMANPTVAHAVRISWAAELIGKTDFDLFPQEMAAQYFADEREVIRSGRPLLNREELTLGADRSPRWLLTSKAPFRDASGEIAGIVGVGRDITERKKLDEALRLSESRFRRLAESNMIGVTIGDATGRFLYANDAYLKMIGYTREDLEASRLRWDTLTAPDQRPVIESIGRQLNTTGLVEPLETVHLHKDGRRVPVLVGLARLEGGEAQAIGFVIDLTEHKRAEEELRRSDERFSLAFNASPEGIAISRLADGVFVDVNEAFLRGTGYTHQEVIGRSSVDLGLWLSPENRTRLLQALQKGPVRDLDVPIPTKSGEVRSGILSARHIEVGGQACLLTTIRDVTERQRTEEALREYEKVVESAQDMMVVVDRQYRYRMANRSFLSYRGLERSQILGMTVADVVGAEVFEKYVKRNLDECFEGKVVRYEARYPYSQLGERDLSLAFYPIAGPAGIDRVACILQDITQRKRAQEALESSERQLAQAMDMAQLAPWELDVASGMFTFNDRLYALYGTTAEREGGYQMSAETYAREFLPPQDAHLVADAAAVASSVPDAEASQALEHRIRRRDGEIRHIVVRASVTKDSQGRVIKVRGVNQDITERKRAEGKIQEQAAYLSSLIASTPLAVVVLDCAKRVELCNPAFEKLFLYPRGEIVGKNLDEVLARGELLNEARGFTEQNLQGKPVHVTRRRYRSDGTAVEVAIHGVPLIVNGEVRGSFGLYEDITERRRAEQELQEAKEAAELANRAKSEFLANMSHEIRTPMNGVIGMTELALDTDLTPEQREYLGMVKDSADSLLTLINDILDFSKIEAGKFTLDVTEFDLRDHVATTIKSLAPRAHQKGLEMLYTLAAKAPARLVGDPTRLRQILVNLLGNSIKFTERGEVTLRVGVESRREDSALLHFSVTDTGIGIPRKKQQSIFDAFSQADSSTTRRYGGSGLGLSICSHLVGMMGGGIWVESEEGRGSTFHFTARLGLQKALAPGAPEAEVETVDLAGMPVLVVDDNATNRRILDAMLRHWKMRAELAEGGSEGLRVMTAHKQSGRAFPLVLIDALMPGMDGFELAAKIKADPALAGATIMMLTSAGQRGDAARCRELGIQAYLIKPIRQSELLDAILTTLGTPRLGRRRPSLVTRHSLREARRKLRILVVEDNAVNQRLAVRLLEKQGHEVDVAANGRQALAKLAAPPAGAPGFDLLLMDVQMPEMDGFEATAAIRREEKGTGRHLPILAMTAHALKGDRERCLAAGMDGYVSKPLHAEELYAALREQTETSRPPSGELPAESARGAPVNRDALLARVEGDSSLLREMAELFLKTYPKLLSEIRQAIERQDAAALERAAHTLKGSVSNFVAHEAVLAATELENMATRRDLARAPGACEELAGMLDRLRPALESLTKEVHS